jgi:hypothetical protein
MVCYCIVNREILRYFEEIVVFVIWVNGIQGRYFKTGSFEFKNTGNE